MTAQDIDDSFFGDAPGVPEFVVKPGFERPELTEKIGETFGWVLTTPDLPEVLRQEQLMNELRASRPDLTKMSDRELIERALGLADEYFEMLFTEHIYISFLATLPIGIITGVCNAVGRPGDVLKLLAGLGDVESAAPSMAMWELGRTVAASQHLGALFDAGVDGLDARLRADDSDDARAFVDAFDAFLYSYGSRGPNEWETRCPTWETDPDLALAAIDRMRLAADAASPAVHNIESATARTALGEEIAAMLEADPGTQAMFLGALQAATVFLPGRERTKTNCVKLIEESRMAYHEYGRRRVAESLFPSVNSFAMLRASELRDSVDHPERYTDVLVERERLFEEVSALQEPFIVYQERPDMSTYPQRGAGTVEPLAAGDVLQGLPGCPGKATGIARIVTDAHHPTALEPGDVLVAPFTDPSWTPLFVPAGAVVVDVGAALSHAIIVSRELGNPCVVSATDATRRIPDGALVEVDGDTGAVTVLSLP